MRGIQYGELCCRDLHRKRSGKIGYAGRVSGSEPCKGGNGVRIKTISINLKKVFADPDPIFGQHCRNSKTFTWHWLAAHCCRLHICSCCHCRIIYKSWVRSALVVSALLNHLKGTESVRHWSCLCSRPASRLVSSVEDLP